MKLTRLIASFGLIFSCMTSITVQAVKVEQIPAEEIQTVYNQKVQSNQLENWPNGPQIYSEAGIVMDIDSGAILYAKNIDNPHYPASITKVLTGLVALENNDLTKTVTITPQDYNFLKRGDNHIGLKNGEQITMEDALHGTLLASGNEVAHAVGSNTEGGYDHFIQLMNEKAKELGCLNSNFVNSHGLHDENHYTSARDMALIGSAAFKNADFRRITNTLRYTIPVTNITNETRTFEQHHKMLFDWRKQYYPYCVGGKTGYTDKALNTLVTFATKDDVNLVAVVLRAHGSGNTYVDTKAMLEYAFGNFKKVPVTVDMVAAEGLESVKDSSYVMLPNEVSYEELQAEVHYPTSLGDKTGDVLYTYKGQRVGQIETTITSEYYNEIHGIEEIKEDKPKEIKENRPLLVVLKVVVIVILTLALLFIIFLCFITYKRRQKRRKRRRELEYRKYVRRMRGD